MNGLRQSKVPRTPCISCPPLRAAALAYGAAVKSAGQAGSPCIAMACRIWAAAAGPAGRPVAARVASAPRSKLRRDAVSGVARDDGKRGVGGARMTIRPVLLELIT